MLSVQPTPLANLTCGFCRFRLINTAAREALVKGGFVKTAETSTGNSGKAKAKDKKAKK